MQCVGMYLMHQHAKYRGSEVNRKIKIRVGYPDYHKYSRHIVFFICDENDKINASYRSISLPLHVFSFSNLSSFCPRLHTRVATILVCLMRVINKL
jgi:hypothetical protein